MGGFRGGAEKRTVRGPRTQVRLGAGAEGGAGGGVWLGAWPREELGRSLPGAVLGADLRAESGRGCG